MWISGAAGEGTLRGGPGGAGCSALPAGNALVRDVQDGGTGGKGERKSALLSARPRSEDGESLSSTEEKGEVGLIGSFGSMFFKVDGRRLRQ